MQAQQDTQHLDDSRASPDAQARGNVPQGSVIGALHRQLEAQIGASVTPRSRVKTMLYWASRGSGYAALVAGYYAIYRFLTAA